MNTAGTALSVLKKPGYFSVTEVLLLLVAIFIWTPTLKLTNFRTLWALKFFTTLSSTTVFSTLCVDHH